MMYIYSCFHDFGIVQEKNEDILICFMSCHYHKKFLLERFEDFVSPRLYILILPTSVKMDRYPLLEMLLSNGAVEGFLTSWLSLETPNLGGVGQASQKLLVSEQALPLCGRHFSCFATNTWTC